MRKLLLLLLTSGFAQAEVPANWKLSACATKIGSLIEIHPETPQENAIVKQRISGPFQAGELLRFSADVELNNILDENGKAELKPFDLNLHPRNVCLTLAQFDSQGRILCAPGSERQLGTKIAHLEMETVVQEEVQEIELRLLATFVTGKVIFKNIHFEKSAPTPLQELPEAKVVKNQYGACGWTFNGKPQVPAMYFGNNQFNRDDRILAEMEKAYGAGVRAFSFNLYLPCLVSNTETLRVVERFMKRFPDAYFMPRVWLGPGQAWKTSFPEEMMKYFNGQIGGYASGSSEVWKNFTDHNLRELVNLIRRSPYAKQCIGFKLTYYQTGEWINWDPHRSAGFDAPTRKAFGKPIPTVEERNAVAAGLFRNPETQQRVIDFANFYNSVNAENIIRFAKTVKETSENRCLTATFYGYIFELAWHEDWLQNGGHLGLEKLYRSPSIDIIGAPYSYNPIGRGFGLPLDMHGPFDGANAFGKLVMIEEDTFTHLAEDVPEVVKGYAPGYASRTTNMDETIAVLRRDLGVAIAHNQIVIWQNLFSEGRFNAPAIWDMYKPYLEWMKQRTDQPAFAPQVAVLTDPSAITQLKAKAYGYTERWIYQNRFFLNRVDTTVGYFHTSELSTLSDSVRCIILLTPQSLTSDEKALLENRFMKDGRTIIFCGTTALEHIQLREQICPILPESKLADGQLFGEHQFGMQSKQPLAPTFAVTDRKARAFAHYTATGNPSCAAKKMDDWTAVFLGSPGMPAITWRDLFKQAGCHLYLADDDFSTDFNHPDFIQANGNFLMVQSSTGGNKQIYFPNSPNYVYRFDRFDPVQIIKNRNTMRVQLQPGTPTFFLFSKK